MNDLKHYGVKGMHWGVRRYQDYDGRRINSSKDFVIKKGTKAYRMSTNPNEKLDDTRKYATLDKDDLDKYKKWFSGDDPINSLDGDADYYQIQNTYEAVQDLKVAGKETALRMLSEIHGLPLPDMSKPIDYEKVRMEWEDTGNTRNPFDTLGEYSKDTIVNPENPSTIKPSEKAEEFSRLLIKEGYDAVIDLNDASNGYTNLPIVFLKPKDQLTEKEKKVLVTPWWDNPEFMD